MGRRLQPRPAVIWQLLLMLALFVTLIQTIAVWGAEAE